MHVHTYVYIAMLVFQKIIKVKVSRTVSYKVCLGKQGKGHYKDSNYLMQSGLKILLWLC